MWGLSTVICRDPLADAPSTGNVNQAWHGTRLYPHLGGSIGSVASSYESQAEKGSKYIISPQLIVNRQITERSLCGYDARDLVTGFVPSRPRNDGPMLPFPEGL